LACPIAQGARPDGNGDEPASKDRPMLDYVRELLNADRFAPHGYCLLWQPELIWTHVISDALIGLSYFSIPVALAYFLTKRRDVQFGWVVWMFATFIMACGITHFFAIWTLWNPDYGPEALVKAGTAAASVFTAVALWPLLPRAIALPSPAQLQRVNQDLTLRIAERDAALAALQRETAERLKAEEMLRQAQKMEAVGQLSGGIAHDFNNMLTVVLANLDKAARIAHGDPKLQRSLADAISGAERAAALTDRLLAFARRQPLQPTKHDPNEIVEGMRSLFERSLGERVRIATDLQPGVWPVSVDRNQMENALLNLAVNARQAMPDGGTLRIATRNVRGEDADGAAEALPGDHVLIEVADSGIGMPPEVRERAFEPFFTTKEVGAGTGLGLSQVYGFTKQSGGSISLESEPGAGTTISIHLPRAPE
jgi:signal transduction histidine kinase